MEVKQCSTCFFWCELKEDRGKCNNAKVPKVRTKATDSCRPLLWKSRAEILKVPVIRAPRESKPLSMEGVAAVLPPPVEKQDYNPDDVSFE